MKRMGSRCLDCGSEAVGVIVDEVRPVYKMTRARFACGALLESTYTANGNVGRVTHSGCTGGGAPVR